MADVHSSMQQGSRRPVMLVRIAAQPTLTPIAGGWLADTGRLGSAYRVLQLVAAALRDGADQRVIWVIQADALAHEIANPGRLCGWLQQLEQLRHLGGGSAQRRIAVVPQTGPQARALAHLLKSLGLCVYNCAPDGCVYAEIGATCPDRPGIAGPVLDGGAALTLRRIADRRAALSAGSAERQDLTLMELLFVQTVLQMCCPTEGAEMIAPALPDEPPILERAVGSRPTPPTGGEAYYRNVA